MIGQPATGYAPMTVEEVGLEQRAVILGQARRIAELELLLRTAEVESHRRGRRGLALESVVREALAGCACRTQAMRCPACIRGIAVMVTPVALDALDRHVADGRRVGRL